MVQLQTFREIYDKSGTGVDHETWRDVYCKSLIEEFERVGIYKDALTIYGENIKTRAAFVQVAEINRMILQDAMTGNPTEATKAAFGSPEVREFVSAAIAKLKEFVAAFRSNPSAFSKDLVENIARVEQLLEKYALSQLTQTSPPKSAETTRTSAKPQGTKEDSPKTLDQNDDPRRKSAGPVSGDVSSLGENNRLPEQSPKVGDSVIFTRNGKRETGDLKSIDAHTATIYPDLNPSKAIRVRLRDKDGNLLVTINEQLTGTPVASTPDARNRPEKPNKRSKDTGTAQPAEEELPSEPASGGRAEQGGREAPSPSSWKGKRVEFVQDGVTLKGTVAAFATVPKHGTFLSVKLDDGFKGAPTRGIYIDELTNSKGDQISGFREIGVAPEKGPETKAEKKIKPPAPAEAEAPPATEPKSEEPEFKTPILDGLLSSILDEIKGWVNTGTGGGARSMDRNWERGAIKRYLSSSSLMTTLIGGKQSGKTATAKVNIGKSTTFAEIIAAVEKLRPQGPVAKTTESQQVAPDVSPSVTDEVAAEQYSSNAEASASKQEKKTRLDLIIVM